MATEQLLAGYVWCVYPISGLYTQFQRILFWVVILLVIFCQLHEWLTAGLVGFAVIYSLTACIHALFLGPQHQSIYDADLFALQVILQASIFGMLLCLLFSKRILNDSAKPVLFWCAILVFAARMIMTIFWSAVALQIHKVAVPVQCASGGLCYNPCMAPDVDVITLFRGKAADTLQPVIWNGTVTQISANSTVEQANDWLNHSPIVSNAGYSWLSKIWIWYACMGPLLHCIIWNLAMRPRQARNYIFCRLCKRYVPKNKQSGRCAKLCTFLFVWMRYLYILVRVFAPELYLGKLLVLFVLWIFELFKGNLFWIRAWVAQTKTTPIFVRAWVAQTKTTSKMMWNEKKIGFDDFIELEESDSKLRYNIAKGCAIAWYLTAYASYVALFGVVLFFEAKSEMSIQWIPEAEAKNAIGQWAPWVALLLGMVASLISKTKQNILDRDNTIDQSALNLEGADPQIIASNAMGMAVKQENSWQFIVSRTVYEWQDFKNWWQNTSEASHTDMESE